ncbi:MAG: hypothetical protein ACKPJD_32705, partial [Planctomycetaceae bacterium]
EAEAAAAAEADESAGKARRVGNPRLVPELFDTLDATEAADNETAEKLQRLDFSRVTEADKSRASSARQPKSRVLDEQTDAADDSESEATEAAVGAAEESADSAAGSDAEESAGGREKAAQSE